MYVCIQVVNIMLLHVAEKSILYTSSIYAFDNQYISSVFTCICYHLFTRSLYFTSLTQHVIWFSTMNSKHPWSFHCCGLLIHPLNLFGPCTAKAKSIGPLDADLRGVGIQLGRRQAVDGCSWLGGPWFFKLVEMKIEAMGRKNWRSMYMVRMVTCSYLHTRLWNWKSLVGVMSLCFLTGLCRSWFPHCHRKTGPETGMFTAANGAGRACLEKCT